MESHNTSGGDLNETNDQVDNLLEELNDLIKHRRYSKASLAIEGIDNHGVALDSQRSDVTSPFLPKRHSMIQDGGTTTSPAMGMGANRVNPFEETGGFKLSEDTDTIQLRQPPSN